MKKKKKKEEGINAMLAQSAGVVRPDIMLPSESCAFGKLEKGHSEASKCEIGGGRCGGNTSLGLRFILERRPKHQRGKGH